MSDSVIRSLTISDFRGLAGTRTLPFDAPIVLIHGPNGAGKTSVLSALELGLTGQIRSMQRHEPRYTAHLPTLGREFATVSVEVCEPFARFGANSRLTAGGSHIDGSPALSPEAAKFYGERCYLDQASLGRLLELYQHKQGKGPSPLARFVNELLGLDELDAITAGLQDARDLRSLKKLAEGLSDAANEAKLASSDLEQKTDRLNEADAEVVGARASVHNAARSLGLSLPNDLSDESTDEVLLPTLRRALSDTTFATEHSRLENVKQELVALGGRIEAMGARPSARSLSEARNRFDEAEEAVSKWLAGEGVRIQAWQREARALGVTFESDVDASISSVLGQLRRQLDSQAELRDELVVATENVVSKRARLGALQGSLREAQEHATSLVEGLAFIRSAVVDELCPVCDRDFSEMGAGQLSEHVDAKVAELSQHGERLLATKLERDKLVDSVARAEGKLAKATAGLLEKSQLRDLEDRAKKVERAQQTWERLREADELGRDLRVARETARLQLEDMVASSADLRFIRGELVRCATALNGPAPADDGEVHVAWEQLSAAIDSRLAELSTTLESQRQASEAVENFSAALERSAEAVALVATAAQRKTHWEAQVKEGQRRQAVARAVLDAATNVRADIVQRVFTKSLNQVWRSVFTRLAPEEGFIPAFGIPASSKASSELDLHTIHRDGGTWGSPQMMLSAGNLNTAALSLFLALHLAVEPVVPCLVFDDPVQAMDEVHVAQFAGLIRVLAKQHGRQVVIAVHERELFDYLAFELSPAYEGDELLTIELGERSLDEDRGVIRHGWTPDSAIAG